MELAYRFKQLDGFSAKRCHPDQHEVKENAQRPDIDHCSVVALVLEEFGRGVRGTSAECVQHHSRVHLAGEAEIA